MFVFENGVLLPHHTYLYEFSETGEPYILGKKLPGIDYSATEAGYAKFVRVDSQTFAASDSTSSSSGWFEGSKGAAMSHFTQPLLWFLFGILCALMIHWTWSKLAARFPGRKNNKAENTMAIPTSDIDAEHSKLDLLWRSTLIGMYRERKSEILSLSKLAGHYYDRSCDLKKKLAWEIKKKGEAKSALEELKAEHVERLAVQQREMDNLRHMLDTQTARAQNLEISNHASAAENATASETVKDLRQRLVIQTTRAQDLASTNRRIEAENAVAEETAENLEEQVQALRSDNEAADTTAEDLEGQFEVVKSKNKTNSDDAEEPFGGDQPQSGITPKEAVAGDQDVVDDLPVESREGKQAMAKATGQGDEDEKSTTMQDNDSPALDDTAAGPKLGKNGKPLIPRANKRADGSIRTPSHPDYVPLDEAPSRLGDRPFHGSGRGNGWNKRRGDGGRNNGGHFGWRGGRGGRGGGGGTWGTNAHNGQSDQGKGH